MNRAAVLVPALLAALTFTAWVTWPQALHLATAGAQHQDTYFSMWRLAWVAHGLTSQPFALFDTNIFHPFRGTLAYSDAMLLQGVLAAPFFWAGLPPLLVYNIMLFAGFAGSGVGMFVLARRLTGAAGPALVAAGVFTMAPYRIEHFMHLELQWAMWIPLTFWAIHRSIEERSAKFGALAGLFLWLQVVSCVYYGVFLALTLAVFVPLVLLVSGRIGWTAIGSLVLAASVAILLTIPYAWPYVRNAQTLGPRDLNEVALYSATPVNYLASPPQGLLWGWTSRWGSPERSLFPGLAATLLALLALGHKPRRLVFVYAVVGLWAFELSLGSHGRLYEWIAEQVSILGGLRAPARFSIVAVCAIAALAGFGAEVARRRWGGGGTRRAAALTAALLAVLMVDYANTGMEIGPIHDGPYDVYTIIRNAGPGVVVELPTARSNALPGDDYLYAFWSHSHWRPLVNGYSGYYPPHYIQTIEMMERFPDDRSIERLKNLGVRFVVVHVALYPPERLSALLLRLAGRSDVTYQGTFRDPLGKAVLFTIAP
jgi:hypothetical protein